MKKIVIVTNSSWYAWNMRANLARAFVHRGFKVIFICPIGKGSKELQNEFEFIDFKMDAQSMNPFKDLKIIFQYYKIYKQLQPDIILQYTIKPNIYGTLSAGILNIPTINNIAGLGSLFIKNNLITKIAKKLYKFSQRRASKIFFQNHDDYELFIKESLVKEHLCDILPGSGVDINKYSPIFSIKSVDKSFIFLLVSRMLWTKGISQYIEAARIIKTKYKNVVFQLLGPIDKNVNSISEEEMQDRVEEGYISYLGISENVSIEMSKVDCIVLPSYYREGTPRSLLEAASMGIPIITTNNVGCKDVVDDGVNGYLCEVKNAPDLALKMEKMLLLTDEERKIMGIAGREKIVKYYDEKIVIDKYIQAIEEII